MKNAGRIGLSLALLALPPALLAKPVANPAGLSFKAGTYRCELNRSVQVRQVAPDLQSAVIHWNKKDYTLKAVSSKSGALRYEDSASGLVWLVIVEKSMLLDSKAGRQLANECRI
jgi:membrane-bound inhibitor of C-type lysozyme